MQPTKPPSNALDGKLKWLIWTIKRAEAVMQRLTAVMIFLLLIAMILMVLSR